jgi:hypothetical protein
MAVLFPLQPVAIEDQSFPICEFPPSVLLAISLVALKDPLLLLTDYPGELHRLCLLTQR